MSITPCGPSTFSSTAPHRTPIAAHRILLVSVMAVCVFSVQEHFAADPVFIKEQVAFMILPPETLKIQGEYFFAAPDTAPCSAALYYLFFLESPERYPFLISVVERRSKSRLSFDENPQGIFFSFTIKGMDTACISITYKQLSRKREVRYSMLTTSAWGPSRETNRYLIRTPLEYEVFDLSYPCTSIDVGTEGRKYQFRRTPDQGGPDISFIWAPARSVPTPR